jgi:hypothetical protein
MHACQHAPTAAFRSSLRDDFSAFFSVFFAVFSAPTPGLLGLTFLRLSLPDPMPANPSNCMEYCMSESKIDSAAWQANLPPPPRQHRTQHADAPASRQRLSQPAAEPFHAHLNRLWNFDPVVAACPRPRLEITVSAFGSQRMSLGALLLLALGILSSHDIPAG